MPKKIDTPTGKEVIVANDLKFVFRSRDRVFYRFRIWVAGKLLPKEMSQFARAWFAGIPVSVQGAEKANRAQRRKM